MKLEELCPPGPKFDEAVVKVKEELQKVADIWNKNEADKLYFFGDEFTFADVVLVAVLLGTKIIAPDLWVHLKGKNDGKWERLLEVTKPFQKHDYELS